MVDAVSTVKVGGNNVATPGAYSQVDLSGAATPGVISNGKIALIGSSVDGKPQHVYKFNSLASILETFAEPGTKDSPSMSFYARLLYTGANDERIDGSPQQVLIVKTNNDTGSTGTLMGPSGALISLTSKAWGAMANQINLSIAAGKAGGVDVTISRLQTVEAGASIGSGASMKLGYTYPQGNLVSNASVDPSSVTEALKITFTLDHTANLDADITQLGAAKKVKVVSTNVTQDNWQKVTVFGLTGGNAPIKEVIEAGKTGSLTFTKVTGAMMDGLSVADVSLKGEDDSAVITFGTAAQKLDNSISAGGNDYSTLKIISDDSTDTGLGVTITGRDKNGASITETMLLNGKVATLGKLIFSRIKSVQIAGTTAGTVKVQDSDNTDLLSLSAGADKSAGFNNSKGLLHNSGFPVTGALGFDGTGAAFECVIRGLDSAGNEASERVAGEAAGTTTTEWSRIDHFELGISDNDAKFTGTMVKFGSADTLLSVETKLNGFTGFAATSFNDERTCGDLDAVTTGIVLGSTASKFYGAAMDVIDWINANSDLVTATRASASASGLPLVTASPTFMAGGTSVSSSAQDFMQAIDKLLAEDVNIIVPLTDNDAVHAYLVSHCKAAALKRSERNGYIGLANGLNKEEVAAKTSLINSEHICAIAQQAQFYNAMGTITTAPAHALACVAAGMQASSSIGTPLTYKYMASLGVVDGLWDPVNDGEELLRSGLMFARNVDGRGTRWVRSITTYQKRSNRVLTEMSANESLNACLKDLRGYLEETLIGQPSTMVNAKMVQGMTSARLETQRGSALIKAYQNISVTIVGDKITIDFEVAPVEPTNFILLTAHVVTLVETAS